MKKIFILFLLQLSAGVVLAQKDSLSFDEHNKYTYYKVVEQPGLTVDTFQNRMLYLLKTTFPQNKISRKTAPGDISGSGKFMVLSGISVVKHIDGEVDYTFHIQYKNERYRYWLTDFVFIPYKNTDNGNPQPQLRLAVTLEHATRKLPANKFARYINETGGYGVRFGKEVRKYMDRLSKERVRVTNKKINISKYW